MANGVATWCSELPASSDKTVTESSHFSTVYTEYNL